MIFRYHLLLSVCLLLAASASGQVFERFHKLAGESSVWNNVTCIDTTFDHGFILGGSRWDNPTESAYLIKTDSSGNAEWIMEYIGSNRAGIGAVIQTSDSGYIFTGYGINYTGYLELSVVKTDALGNVIWSYTFHNGTVANPVSAGGTKIIEDNNSFYVLGGFDHIIGDAGAIILRLDYSGNLIHSNTVYTPYNGNFGSHAAITFSKMQNGNFIATFPYQGYWSFVFCFDPLCQLEWSYSFRIAQSLYNDAIAIRELTDGNFLFLTRSTDSSAYECLYLSTITVNGNVISTNKYDFGLLHFGRIEAIITDEDEIVITGGIHPVSSNWQAFRLKIGANGSVITCESDSTHVSENRDVQQLANGTFVITGNLYDSLADSHIIKTDQLLRLGCDAYDIPVQVTPGLMIAGAVGGGVGSDIMIRNIYGLYRVPHQPDRNTFCEDYISIANISHAERPEEYFIPNAFSPNGDGLNDIFIPVLPADISTYHLMIFNRWGQLLFESSNPDLGWDGTFKSNKCQQGAYAWRVAFTTVDGIASDEFGHVVLID